MQWVDVVLRRDLPHLGLQQLHCALVHARSITDAATSHELQLLHVPAKGLRGVTHVQSANHLGASNQGICYLFTFTKSCKPRRVRRCWAGCHCQLATILTLSCCRLTRHDHTTTCCMFSRHCSIITAAPHLVLEVHVEQALRREAPQLVRSDLVAADGVMVRAAVAAGAQHAAAAPARHMAPRVPSAGPCRTLAWTQVSMRLGQLVLGQVR
jgi:hypothetical protein